MSYSGKFGFDLDNTLINYDGAAARWASANQLGEINSVENLKEFYRNQSDYSREWLTVQEWLYTDGLKFAELSIGGLDVIKRLQTFGFSVIIVSHKSSRSAKSFLDLRSPARKWLALKLSRVNFDLETGLFFEENRSGKICRIRREKVTHFVDDLIDVFVEPEFPREVEGFWLKSKSNEILPKHVKPIDDLSQILDYV